MDLRQHCRLLVVVAVHAVLDLALLLLPWMFSHLMVWAVVALPVSQNSLLAIWACTGRGSAALRMSLWPVGVFATWVVLIGISESPMVSAGAAGWGAGMTVQALAIGIVLWTLRLVRVPREAATRRFTLRSLLLAVLVTSIALGLLRTVVVTIGWEWNVILWEYFIPVQVVSLLSAAYALVVHLTLVTRGFRPTAIVQAASVIAGLCVASVLLFARGFSNDGGYTWTHAIVFAVAQTVSLTISLVVLDVRGPQRRSGPDA